MKNSILKYLAAAAVVVGMTLSVQAIPIVGGISLAGNVVFNTGDINNATAAQFNAGQVTSVAGSYAGQGIAMNVAGSVNFPPPPLSFNPFVAHIPLWQTPTAAGVASFDLTSLTQRLQPGDNTLILKGVGTLHLTGFTDTPGDWVFSANAAGGTFSFSSSNSAIPDGGMTAMLLGAALSGLGLLRRKLA
jgi:hypothetical protein